jgi:hypothetical protein
LDGLKGLLVDRVDDAVDVLPGDRLQRHPHAGECVPDLPLDEIAQLPFNPLHGGGVLRKSYRAGTELANQLALDRSNRLLKKSLVIWIGM